MKNFIDACLESLKTETPYPSFTEFAGNATLEGAYEAQQLFIAAQAHPLAGYKAALTAQPAQQAMGIESPVLGVLFEHGRSRPSDRVTVPGGGVLETELGFVLAKDINEPVQAETVMDLIDRCHTMIEVARPNLAGKPNGLDLIATNSAAYHFIEGAAFSPRSIEIDDVQAELVYEGETVFTGRCGDVMGGQRAALAWLINALTALGYSLKAGHLLMTGSVGGVAPSKPGQYQGRFSGLGEIGFTIA